MDEPEWIRLHEAVELVAKFCYPDEGNYRNTKNKARRRIAIAVQKDLLDRFPDRPSWKFNKHDFHQWAVTEWPDLRNSLSIPHVREPDTTSLRITGFSPRVHITPSDPVKLLDELNRCRNTIEEQRAEIDRLRVIESYWTAHVEQDQIRRKKQGEHGQKGRGVKKN